MRIKAVANGGRELHTMIANTVTLKCLTPKKIAEHFFCKILHRQRLLETCRDIQGNVWGCQEYREGGEELKM